MGGPRGRLRVRGRGKQSNFSLIPPCRVCGSGSPSGPLPPLGSVTIFPPRPERAGSLLSRLVPAMPMSLVVACALPTALRTSSLWDHPVNPRSWILFPQDSESLNWLRCTRWPRWCFSPPGEKKAQAGATGRPPGTQSSLGAPLNMWFGVTPAPVPKASFAPKSTPLLLLEVGSEQSRLNLQTQNSQGHTMTDRHSQWKIAELM